MDLYGFAVDGEVVDEIVDRVLKVHDNAEFTMKPFTDSRTALKDAIEQVLWSHNIITLDRTLILTNLEKEDI